MNDNIAKIRSLDAAAAALLMTRVSALLRPRSVAALREQAGIGAALLKSKGAARVRLFGSVARATEPDWHTDVDLAVNGLPPARYFEALGGLLSTLTCSVDLIEYECASESLRNEIDRDGIEL